MHPMSCGGRRSSSTGSIHLPTRPTRARIVSRLLRLAYGNPGDVRPVGGGVSELRVHFGPGYRVYFIRLQHATILLLVGGDKDSQQRDIRRARELAMEYRDS